jgi:predicted secreted protein
VSPKVVEPEELDVEGAAGEPITLPITVGPATGYEWELELPAGVEQLDDEPGEEPAEHERLGGSTGAHLRVRAPAGEHVILARLARPWERDRPERVVRLRLDVR